MDDSSRDPQSDVPLVDGSEVPKVDAQPKKLLLGKRVIRTFNVRSGLRTGEPPDVSLDSISGTSNTCGRSR